MLKNINIYWTTISHKTVACYSKYFIPGKTILFTRFSFIKFADILNIHNHQPYE